MKTLRQIYTVIEKELVLERRSSEFSISFISLSVISATLLAFGINGGGLDPEIRERIFPTLFWILMFLSFTTTCERAYAAEGSGESLRYAARILKVPTEIFFLAKTFISFSITIGVGILLLFLTTLFLFQSFPEEFGELIIILLVTSFGLASLGTLLSGIAHQSPLRGTLLPIILLPVAIPLFFGSIELTNDLMLGGRFSLSSGSFIFTAGLSILYFVFGLWLFRAVVEE